MFAFAVIVLVIATVADRLDFGPRAVLGTALFGLFSHPFGDLFTGTSPQFLYPFDRTLIDQRITISSSPTEHLLAAMGIELLVVWIAAIVFFCSLIGSVVLTDIVLTIPYRRSICLNL
jgi:membrane-bound metal-dependent hydrolase YbcI (DUF457 family)